MALDQFAQQVIAAHGDEESYTPRSRQLTGMTSDDETRVFQGLIRVDFEGKVRYYAEAAIRQFQAKGGVTDDDIERQSVFIENCDEIWNAKYPPPPRKKPAKSYSNSEDEY